jgi:hypothetical protein
MLDSVVEHHIVSIPQLYGCARAGTFLGGVFQGWKPFSPVAAITSQFEEPPYPSEVLVSPPEGGLVVPSVVLLNQIRSLDRWRLVRRLGVVAEATMARVDQALRISMGLIELRRNCRSYHRLHVPRAAARSILPPPGL